MSYYPIITTGSIDPFTDGYFLLAGNRTGNFSPGDQFIAYDTYVGGSPTIELTQSAIYIFTVSATGSPIGSPQLGGTYFDGVNTRVFVVEGIPDIASYGRQWVQAADDEYVIYWSDEWTGSPSGKPPMTIQAATLDSTTDLNLPGRGTLGYGEAINTSLLHLLENFAAPHPPGWDVGSPTQESPVIGQLWYDTSVNQIKVWSGTLWEPFDGSGTATDETNGDGTAVVTTTVNVAARAAGISYQQVFLNGILQRENLGSPGGEGNYHVTGANQLTFAFNVLATDDVTVYAL